MSWTELRVTHAPASTRAAIVAAMIGNGASCVVEDGEALATYVDDSTDLTALEDALRTASPHSTIARAEAGDISWSTRWPTRVGVQRVGALTVAPPWLAEEAGDASRAIIIEPAMAFGTGEHETTRGVLRLMQSVVREGDFVADLGAGSAVLAIAAAKLGAARVIAIEMDADAISNAEENVARNGVEGRVTVLEGDAAMMLPLVAPVRVIFANIISSVLLEISTAMREALTLDGCAILSGMLVRESEAMRSSLEEDGWTIGADDAEGDWWSVVITPARAA